MSVFSAFNKKGRRHKTLDTYLKSGINLEDYFKFSFVRNPYALLVSWYHYQIEVGRSDKSYKSFSEWVLGGCRSHATHTDSNTFAVDGTLWDVREHLYQHKWVASQDEPSIKVDFIGRFENFQEDFNTVCDKIGIPHQELPYENKSKHTYYTEYYDDETRQIVAEKYAKDIEMFGYEFGS